MPAEKLLDKARDCVKKKNFEYAVTMYIEYLKAHPDDVESRKELRAAERLQLKMGGAPNIFTRKKLDFQVQAIRIGKDPEKSMIACEEILKQYPDCVGALIKLGEAAAHASHNDVAIMAFEDALGVDKDNKEALRLLGRVYKNVSTAKEEAAEKRRCMESALKCFQRLAKVDPKDKEAMDETKNIPAIMTGNAFKQGLDKGGFQNLIDKDKASNLERNSQRIRTAEQALERISELEDAVQKNPRDTKTIRMIAELYYKHTDQHDEAVAWLDKGLKLEPQNFLLAELKGTIIIERMDKQIQQLEAAAKKDPSLKPRLEAAKQKKLTVEIDEFRKRCEAHPTEYGIRYDLGKALWDAGQVDEAIPELQKAKADARKKAEAGYYLGRCFVKKQVFNMAVKEFKQAREDLVEMDALKKEITYMLARIYEQARKRDEAVKEYEAIAEHDFNYRDVTKRLEALSKL